MFLQTSKKKVIERFIDLFSILSECHQRLMQRKSQIHTETKGKTFQNGKWGRVWGGLEERKMFFLGQWVWFILGWIRKRNDNSFEIIGWMEAVCRKKKIVAKVKTKKHFERLIQFFFRFFFPSSLAFDFRWSDFCFFFPDNDSDDVWYEVHKEGLWADWVNKCEILWISFIPRCNGRKKNVTHHSVLMLLYSNILINKCKYSVKLAVSWVFWIIFFWALKNDWHASKRWKFKLEVTLTGGATMLFFVVFSGTFDFRKLAKSSSNCSNNVFDKKTATQLK